MSRNVDHHSLRQHAKHPSSVKLLAAFSDAVVARLGAKATKEGKIASSKSKIETEKKLC